MSRLNLTVCVVLALAGCGRFGTVNQGQVIDYRQDTGTVTLIADSNYRDQAHPRFDVLPPVTIRTPENPAEMGPAPQAGKLLRVDAKARRLSIFNTAARRIEEVPYTVLGTSAGCAAAPVIDRERKTITLCVDRQSMVVSVPAEYFALPDDTWQVGDEVRYYEKESTRALRMMNVTKTNLNKGD